MVVRSSQRRNILIQSDSIKDVFSVVDLLYTAKRETKSFEFISLKNGFNENEISSTRDKKGDEDQFKWQLLEEMAEYVNNQF